MNRRDTILVADDVEINRAVLRSIFEEDYNVLEAENGEQALFLMRQYRDSIAIVLLDLIMPVRDGYEVMEERQADPSLRGLPVAVITADDSVRSGCLTWGPRILSENPSSPIWSGAESGISYP